MKYSLRSLMIVVTLACVVLGGRIEYLRRWAAYHEQEAIRIHGELIRKMYAGIVKSTKWPDGSYTAHEIEDASASRRHSEIGKAFRQAVYRPWTLVEDPENTTAP